VPIPDDYLERVYAGVLGKIIGVYLGRPFEGWTYDRITAQLGEIRGYVHERLNKLLVVTDDDISGTFTFLRALQDTGCRRTISPAEIGNAWLNYLVEERTILWWGGLGNSTEHTAYLRLKDGVFAPQSGSIETNTRVVAEQIGAQIFIDGWAMVAPGDPELAASLARRAGSVSHDGEALHAASALAAMEALAFVESDLAVLLEAAVSVIPKESIVYRLYADLRERRLAEPDWRKTRQYIVRCYGYDKFPGNCHVIPNHALILLGLLYGEDDFQTSLMITNTSGWDTDCNSGNLGCLLGIKNSLAGIDAGKVDWRGPVADRLYLPSADGGRAISDAAREAVAIANLGRELANLPPQTPKLGARFHFELPGSVQGFQVEGDPAFPGTLQIENAAGHSRTGDRSLALHWQGSPGNENQAGQTDPAADGWMRVSTPTFIPPEARRDQTGYQLLASPTLYPGQVVRTRVEAGANNGGPVCCALVLQRYIQGDPGGVDALDRVSGPQVQLLPGEDGEIEWQVPDQGGAPIATVGIEILHEMGGGRTGFSKGFSPGSLYLDFLTWEGDPAVTFCRPEQGGTMWRQAWVNAVDQYRAVYPEAFRLVQNRGRGLLIQGTQEWRRYRVSAGITPHMVQSGGIAARVQGLRRYYALLLAPQSRVRLVKHSDAGAGSAGEQVLAEAELAWQPRETYDLALEVSDDPGCGARLQGWVDGRRVFDLQDNSAPLEHGAVALVCEAGTLACEAVHVQPVLR